MIQVSFSGGRSSAMMAKIMLDNYDKDDLLFIFANTGKELEETLVFVNECDKRWALNMVWVEYCSENKFKVVDFETASRNGEPFEALIRKRNFLPNLFRRFCTTDLKIKPMEKYILSLGFKHWDAAIGIRYDEPNRYHKLKNSSAKKRWDYIFPLWDFRITQKQVVDFWNSQKFDLTINSAFSNCDFCFIKKLSKKVSHAKLMPDKLEWWIDMEKLIDSRFVNEYSMEDVKALAKQPTLFDDNNPDINCFCGD